MRFGLIAILICCPVLATAASPTVADPRLKLELVAAAPDIVTPTGLAVDSKGRIWCLENHTHHRPPEYKGPPTDRVRVFEDFDASGKARKIWTFAEGFRDSMGLSFGPDGALYLATRAKIFRIVIKDDKESDRKVIIKLETKGDYPHNGLCGFAWDFNGDLIFGLGENLGEPYRLIGSDGTTLTGGGEGGSMYRCHPDGSHVSRICTGFWNPFAHCVDSKGRLFVVDNDPDSRGPCRLLHAVQGGDFGYRFRYGRKGTHPFQSWDGELPGTLPMVAGTSEAPSGILEYVSDHFPRDYRGKLFVTSWGDHTVEAFELTPRGASVSALPRIVVRGDENFRPVAIVTAPDGSLVFNDWVDKSYPVHGKGRIWRISAKNSGGRGGEPPRVPTVHPEDAWFQIARDAKDPAERMQAMLHVSSPKFARQFMPLLADSDPFLVSAALEALGRPGNSRMLLDALAAKPQAPLRLGMLLALRRTGDSEAREIIEQFFADPEPGIRRAAIQWVAEERLTRYSDMIAAAASKLPVTSDLFESWLAARELLEGKANHEPKKEVAGEEYVAAILKDTKQPAVFRKLALQMLRPDHPALTSSLLTSLFHRGDSDLRGAVVRTAMLRPDAGAQTLLRQIAADGTVETDLRAFAVLGLGHSDQDRSTRVVLQHAKKFSELRADAERSLGEVVAEPKHSVDEWRRLLAKESGDAKAGERVFFHPKGAGCFKCHRVDNRGGIVGPDLSFIARSSNRDKLIDSILEPSKEIAPMYTSWKVLTRDGKERVGLWLGETFDSFVMIGDAQGKIEKIHRTQVEERTALTKSIMPDDLPNLMTKREFADLLAYLLERK